jgi:hypothetical protein
MLEYFSDDIVFDILDIMFKLELRVYYLQMRCNATIDSQIDIAIDCGGNA